MLPLVYTYDASRSTRKSACEPGRRKNQHKRKKKTLLSFFSCLCRYTCVWTWPDNGSTRSSTMEKEVISYQRTNKQMYPARFIEKEHRTCVYPGAYAYLTRVNVFVLILVLMLMFASYVWQQPLVQWTSVMLKRKNIKNLIYVKMLPKTKSIMEMAMTSKDTWSPKLTEYFIQKVWNVPWFLLL